VLFTSIVSILLLAAAKYASVCPISARVCFVRMGSSTTVSALSGSTCLHRNIYAREIIPGAVLGGSYHVPNSFTRFKRAFFVPLSIGFASWVSVGASIRAPVLDASTLTRFVFASCSPMFALFRPESCKFRFAPLIAGRWVIEPSLLALRSLVAPALRCDRGFM
jgi:hypothetical protein